MSVELRLTVTLIVTWLLLSGLFKTQLLILGVLSVALVVWLAMRMSVLRHRGQPVYMKIPQLLRYWSWLFVEIMRSNWTVARALMQRDVDIRPSLRAVTATPDTEIGRVIYANSITLTPGTTAINFTRSGDILVHALQSESLDDLEQDEMARRVREVEPHGVPDLPLRNPFWRRGSAGDSGADNGRDGEGER